MLLIYAYVLGDCLAPAHSLWANRRLGYRKAKALICVLQVLFGYRFVYRFGYRFGYRPGEGIQTVMAGSFWTHLQLNDNILLAQSLRCMEPQAGTESSKHP